MVNHNWRMKVIKKEQINWERSHNFGIHLSVFNEVRSKFSELKMEIENLICDVRSWSLRRCFSKQFNTGSDELLPRV